MKRALVLFVFLLAAAVRLTAADNVSGDGERKKVGLVLSGGGAKGVAHIGVLKVLEEAEIPIDYIAGTSMGAIVGGLYSIGYSPEELDSLVRTQDWNSLLSDRVNRSDKLISEKEITDTYLLSVPMSLNRKFSLPSGVVAGQNVLNLLNELTIGYHDRDVCFDSLQIPFACVAFDMVEGKEVVFQNGNLPTAIRSSMSIPGAFAPVLLDSMVLVDGGIYNNFPVDVVRRMGADIIIGIDLFGGPHDMGGLNSIMGIVDQITTFLGRTQYNLNCENLDLHIKPNIKPYNAASFSPEAIDTLLLRGETATRQKWDEILRLKEEACGEEICAFTPPTHRITDSDSLRIGNISFAGLTRNEETLMRFSLGIKENESLTKAQLNEAIGRLRGSGAFSYVTYTLESNPPYTLSIAVDEKQEALVNVGFRFDSEVMAAIQLNTTLSFRGIAGPKLGITGRLSDNPYVKLDFNTRALMLGRLGASYMFKSNNYRVYENGQRIHNVAFGQHRVDVFFADSNFRRYNINAGIRFEYLNYDSFLYAPDRDRMAVMPGGYLNYYIEGGYENLNDRYYPTSGYSLLTQAILYTDNGYQIDGAPPFGAASYNFYTAVSFTDRITIVPAIYGRTIIGNSIAYPYINHIGGELAGRYVEQQIPFVGINRMEYISKSVMSVSLEARMRLFMRHYVSVKGSYAIHDDNFLSMFANTPNALWGVGAKYSYDSPIGPISIQFAYSNAQKSPSVYFSLGKNF